MATSPKKGDDHQMPPNTSTVILMLTIADTTWRLFIPSVGFTILGVVLDKQYGTKPWLMITGIILGVMAATLLVRLQIKKVNK